MAGPEIYSYLNKASFVSDFLCFLNLPPASLECLPLVPFCPPAKEDQFQNSWEAPKEAEKKNMEVLRWYILNFKITINKYRVT